MALRIGRFQRGLVVFEQPPGGGAWRFAPETPPPAGFRAWEAGRVFVPAGLHRVEHFGTGSMKALIGGAQVDVPKMFIYRTPGEGYLLPILSDAETRIIITPLGTGGAVG